MGKRKETPEWRNIASAAGLRGISAREIQERSGIAKTTFYEKRTGRKGWYTDEIMRIAKICHMTDAQILATVKGEVYESN